MKFYYVKLSNEVNVFYILSLLVCSVSILFLIPAGFSSGALISASDNKKSQMKQIETDLSREKEQFLKFDFKEKSILEQLSNIEKAVTEKRELIRELRGKIRLHRNELKRRQEILNQQVRLLREIEERLGKRLVAFYKHVKRGYVQILATSKDLDQLRKRMKYLKVIVDEDRMVLQQMAKEQLKYKRELSFTEGQLAVIDSMEKAEKTRLLSIKKDLEKKVILLANIHREKEFYQIAVKELQLAAQNLKETLLNLERNQQKKKPLPSGFENSKGRLPLPFNGKIIKSKSRFRAETVNTHKGIYIKGPIGAEIKAIFPGRVDFSGWLKGYGQIIVINHGSRFFTISAHLLQRSKEEGEMVDKGEAIGLLGQTGSLMGPRLYFEIRKAGANLDPLKWLKVN